MKKKRKNNFRSPAVVLVAVFVLIAAFIGMIIFYQARRTAQPQPAATTAAATESGSAAPPASQPVNAAAYYRENAQTLISVTPVAEATQVYSEKEVCEELAARGFEESFPVKSEYEMDGSLNNDAQADKTADTAHPQYTLSFVSSHGEYWTVTVSNRCVSAYPVNYNLEHNSGAEVILTENDSITAYDSQTNSFYELIPKQSVLEIKHIPAITAEALEQLTSQEIEKL